MAFSWAILFCSMAAYGWPEIGLQNKPFSRARETGKQEDEKNSYMKAAQPGTLILPMIQVKTPSLGKRDILANLLRLDQAAYWVQLNIGNPAQTVAVTIDTGSSELWINPDCTNLPQQRKTTCQNSGHYDLSRSSTAQKTNETSSVRYGDTSGANISYVIDEISIPPSTQTIKHIQFGVATSSNGARSGILGIGYGEGLVTNHKNFIDEIADQGLTSSKAYSVSLGKKTNTESAIIFGGVDTAKYFGALTRVPIIPADKSPDRQPRIWVEMQSLQHISGKGQITSLRSDPLPVVLDTGATLTLLPQELADSVAQAFGLGNLNADGYYDVDCNDNERDQTLAFNLGNVSIQIAFRDLIIQAGSFCIFGIKPTPVGLTLLGDTFLRSTYAVFDLSDNMTYLAPYSNCGSQIVNIEKNNPISSILGICTQNTGVPGPTNRTGQTSTSPIQPIVTGSANYLSSSCFALLVMLTVSYLAFF